MWGKDGKSGCNGLSRRRQGFKSPWGRHLRIKGYVKRCNPFFVPALQLQPSPARILLNSALAATGPASCTSGPPLCGIAVASRIILFCSAPSLLPHAVHSPNFCSATDYNGLCCLFCKINIPRHSRGFFICAYKALLPAAP